MIPEYVYLEGAIGIKAGLGRDVIDIDLAGLMPEDALRVAIKGDNGSGKSTLMNLGLSPWLNPPQIPGNAYDHFDGDGVRLLRWTHNGARYESQIEYHQTKKTKKTSAYLHVEQPDGLWEPYEMADRTVSDGKTRTYQACLEDILGPQSIYYLSAFRAQNAPKLGDYDDPEGLMEDLLRLGHIRDLADQAQETKKLINREYERKLRDVESIKELETQLAEKEGQLTRLNDVIAFASSEAKETEKAHSSAKVDYENAKASGIDAEKSRIKSEREKIERAMAHEQEVADGKISGERQRVKMLEASMRDALSQHDKEIASMSVDIEAAEMRIARRQAVLDKRTQIQDAVEQIDAIQDRIASADKVSADLLSEQSQAHETDKARKETKHRLSFVESDINQLNVKLTDCNRRAGFVSEVPCGGEGAYATCPALVDAMCAKSLAPSVEEDIKAKQLKRKHLDVELAEQEKRYSEFSDLGERMHKASGELKQLRFELDAAQRLASLSESLANASEEVDTDKEKIKELESSINSAMVDKESKQKEISADITKIDLSIKAIEEALLESLSVLQAERSALPDIDESDLVAEAESRMDDAHSAMQAAAKRLAQVTSEIEQKSAEIKAMESRIENVRNIQKECDRLSSEVAGWDLLKMALRGVIDLTIEDAGPTIANHANTLLRDAYGPRFTVNIVTQRELQNGNLTECFDISVIDAETGIESSILNKSGGESVWMDKALTDSVALYQQEASGIHYEAIFADEAEDGLTAERKMQFYKMDRAAMEIGGFKRKFFVSHDQAAWTMADFVIDMEDYRC